MLKKGFIFNILICSVLLCMYIYTMNLSTKVEILKNELKYTNAELDNMENKVSQNVDSIEKLHKGLKVKDIKKLTITGYSPRKRETDSTPLVTASMEKVSLGGVAVSRDLFNDGWVFGSRIYIEGYGIFRINDLMNGRFKNSIDIFFWDTKKAIRFGKKDLAVALVKD